MVLTLFFLIALGFASPAFAGGFQIQLACSQMPETFVALKKWTESHGGDCRLPGSVPTSSSAKSCNADVSACVPKEVKDFAAQPSQVYGPNCWNLALVMAGILPARRYTSREEMAYFMRSPLCREVLAKEPKQPGDIGAFRARSTSKKDRKKGSAAPLLEVHGFIWISEDLVYSKNGTDASKPYALYPRAALEQNYRESQKVLCKEFAESCTLELQTFRCQSLDSYLQSPANKIDKDLKEAFKKLESAEKRVSTLNFSKTDILPRENILQSLQVLASVFDSPEFEEKLAGLPKDEKDFIEGSISFRLNSMYHQMAYIEERESCPTCKLVTEELKESSEALRD